MRARLLCPGYSAHATAHPATCLPAFSCPGYSAQATEHPASCLPVCLLDRLLCPGYCTPCHMPACLFAGQATLPRLLHTLPPACFPVCLAWLFCPGYSAQATAHPATCLPLAALSVCWTGYSAQATAHPATLPACLPVCICWTGYSAQATAHPATCLLGAQATLPRLLNTLPPACLFCLPGYSAQANAHPATCLPARLLARSLCPANPALRAGQAVLPRLLCLGYCTP